MAIKQVRVQVNGTWHNLTYNSANGKYEKTLIAPNLTSYNKEGRYYPVTVEATNTVGTKTTVNDTSPIIGNSLKLRVKETIKPTINITSPGAGAYVTNSKQPIVFQLRDEVNGSGVNIDSLVLKIGGGTAIGNGFPGMLCNEVTNGYDCIYAPQTALPDGKHTVTINISDFDDNRANQASRSYTVDTVPPSLNITNPSDNFITNKAPMVVQGSTNDVTSSPVIVTIKLNGADQGPVTVSGGNFSKSITLKEGANTIVVTSKDAAGRETKANINGTLDTSVPQVTDVLITPNPVDAGVTMVVSVEVSG